MCLVNVIIQRTVFEYISLQGLPLAVPNAFKLHPAPELGCNILALW